MNSVGIYFGPKLISIVESRGRRFLKSVQVPQVFLSGIDIEEKVPADVKLIEAVAILKDELRRNKIDIKEATLCLSGKDLVVRTFDLPVMSRQEMQSAVNFEAKKYIPFKAEDIISDFQVYFDKVSNTNQVLFLGIKKDLLSKYLSVFKQLNIRLRGVEYSASSLLRCLKLAGGSEKGIVGLVAVDTISEDEINFSVIENGIPLFSRDISLSSVAQGVAASEVQPNEVMDKLKSEIRVSLDYYNRKFHDKKIQKMNFICSQDEKPVLEAFMSELGLACNFLDILKCMGNQPFYSLNFVKGFAASLAPLIRTNVKVDLLAADKKAQDQAAQGLKGPEVLAGGKEFKFDFRIFILAVFVCFITFFVGNLRLNPLKEQLKQIIANRVKVVTVSSDKSYEELTGTEEEYRRKLKILDDLVKKQMYVIEPLNTIPRVLPEGVWLKDFKYSKQADGNAELILNGNIFLGDSDKEFATASVLLSSLKKDAGFSNVFRNIAITNINSEKADKNSVTSFTISCKNY
jgi:hypothetical protein